MSSQTKIASPSEGLGEVVSILDTDLLKLTMHCAILRYFPEVRVSYALDNRTPNKRFSRAAFAWLEAQIKGTKAVDLDRLD